MMSENVSQQLLRTPSSTSTESELFPPSGGKQESYPPITGWAYSSCALPEVDKTLLTKG